MFTSPRELEGREVFEALQQFEWRYQTLESDYEELMQVRDPEAGLSTVQHQFTVREGLHDAERLLHHYLSGYYSFKCLVTTLAEEAPDPEFCGRVKDRRDDFSKEETSRAILGLRHYVQHHNILPVVIKMSSLRPDGPWYVINKEELRQGGFEYQEPQMVQSVEHHTDWFDYYFATVDSVCIYPFQIIERNQQHLEALREDIYELAKSNLQDEISEYVSTLDELIETRENLRRNEKIIDELIEEIDLINPDLRDLLLPAVYDRIVDE